MKKFTAIAILFVLTASLMTGCRSKAPEETAGPTTMPATEPSTTATMPTILPTMPTEGTDAIEDTTSGTADTAPRGRRPMPIE